MTRVYDFADLARWDVVEVAGNRYLDPNAEVSTCGRDLLATVDPFTWFRTNAKLMFLSTERVEVDGPVECGADMAVRTHRQVPFDLADAYGTLNVVDFATGLVLNCAATNDTVYLVLEQLGRFRHRVVLDIDTGPGQRHRYAVRYRSPRLDVSVDGRLRYRTRTPVAVQGFQLGVGVFSTRDRHGQGATVRWSPWSVRPA